MPRRVIPLSDTQIKTARPQDKNYRLSDGDGLYLLITTDSSKLWRFDYYRPASAKRNTLSLGSYPSLTLAQARQERERLRSLVARGIDPAEQRKQDQREAQWQAANTFEQVTAEWLEKMADEYAPATMVKARQHLALPLQKMGRRPVSELSAAEILDVCRIKEKQGHLEAARKTLNKITQVLRYAVQTSRLKAVPTVDLKGALKTPKTQHMAAIVDPIELGRLLGDVEHYNGRSATVDALRLAPMLFIRPGELRAMRWADVDLQNGRLTYTPPKTRQALGTQLVVPLPRQALAILRERHVISGHTDFVFPANHTTKRCMSDGTINNALRRMGWEGDQVCGHGFRATARTLLEEELGFEPELIDMQLGHRVKDSNGRAYNRTWMIKPREKMMQAWADYLQALRDAQDLI